MKRLKHVSGWVCSAAVLVTVLITPINGIITLSIPDGDSDSFVWTAARDHPNKRIGDNPRSVTALISKSMVLRDEVAVHEVAHFASVSPELTLNGFITIRGPP